MGKIKELDLLRYSAFFTGLYIDNSGEENKIIFRKSYNQEMGPLDNELIRVTRQGKIIPQEDPLWEDIQRAVRDERWEVDPFYLGKDEDVMEFTLDIGVEWIDALDSLIEEVLTDSNSTPESALEIQIFTQIKCQRNRMRD